MLACPDFLQQFTLQTNASKYGLDAVLTQHTDNGEKVIACASRSLSNVERDYSATELKCLAVVWRARHFRRYLEGYKFEIINDHQSLQWLQKLESPMVRLARWLFELQQYNYEVLYQRSFANIVAHTLLRRTAVEERRTMPMVLFVKEGGQKKSREVPGFYGARK